MSESVGSAVARVQAPSQLIESSLSEFGKVLPSGVKPEAFGRWALTVLKKGLADPKQAEAWARVLDPANGAGLASVMSALLDAASLGLEPGREYHLVPFGGTVTGITDYKGEIRLITNASASASVVAQLVRERDEFYMTGANIPPRHDADWFGDRGEITGGYAFVDYGDRCSQVVRMSETQFQRHREKARTKNVWDEWPEAMRVKTLVHQLRKLVPWSAERLWS